MENFDTMTIPTIDDNLIKDLELRNYIEYKLGKTIFFKEDLENITFIKINGQKINGEMNIVNFTDLNLFPNLEGLELSNLSISEEINLKLKKIKNMSFINCEIENFKEFENLEGFSVVNSTVEDFTNLINFSKIKEFELDNVKGIDNFDFLIKYRNLESLKIKYMTNFNLDYINDEAPIKFISIEGIKNINLEPLIKFKQLKMVSIKSDEFDNLDVIEKMLEDRGIKIISNDIYSNVGEEYDQGI